MTRYRQRVHKFESNRHFHTASDQHNHAENNVNQEEDEAEYLVQSAGHFTNSSFEAASHVDFLIRQLVYSRLFLLLFQCAIDMAMRDSATDAFKGIHAGEEEQENRLIYSLLGGLTCWDARHFLHIAEFGYLWESSLAFFPLFPVVLRVLGTITQQFVGNSISLFSAMLVSGVALNNALFVFNGLLLFRLVLLLNGGNLKEAILAVYIHCWCPASIFYSALYTESLYLTFTLFGLLHLYSSSTPSRQCLLVTSAIFSLAFLTRSNGLTNVGFVGYQLLLDSILVRTNCPQEGGQQLEFRECSLDLAKRLIKNGLFLLLCFVLMSLPLRVFEFTAHDKFCSLTVGKFMDSRVPAYLRNGTGDREIVLPGDLIKLHWCSSDNFVLSSNLLLPSYYPHIQQKYWDVGLFAYWQWRKFPLFLMAAPTIFLALYGSVKQTFRLLSTDLRPIPEILVDRHSQIPFACHTMLLAFSGLCFYNVEVCIRLLFSASPFLYLVLARLISEQTPEYQKPDQLMHSAVVPFLRLYMRMGIGPFLVFCYLFGFFIFGTMMHVNWLPFV